MYEHATEFTQKVDLIQTQLVVKNVVHLKPSKQDHLKQRTMTCTAHLLESWKKSHNGLKISRSTIIYVIKLLSNTFDTEPLNASQKYQL